jgi:hypothetical protein
VVNTILEKSSRMVYHTDLRLVFEALGGRQRDFNWLLTDWELNYCPPGLGPYAEKGLAEARWFTGADLTDIVNAYEVQFIWGVLSGFNPGISIDITALEAHPFADGNRVLWTDEVKIQHPSADVEIVCWDASATILLTSDDDLTERFRAFFPEALDLDEYNRNLRAAGQSSSAKQT